MLIHQNLLNKVSLANLRSDVDKLDIDKLKNVTTKLGNLKSKVDKLDVDKLVPVPVDLSQLSDVVKDYVVKKDVYNAKIQDIEDKIPDITNLSTNTTLNAKINEVKNEITSITNLTTTTTDHDHDKYIATQDFIKLTSEDFAARLVKLNLASKVDIATYVKKTDFDDKLKNSNKNELNELSKKVKAISTKGLTKDLINKFSVLNGTKYFSS